MHPHFTQIDATRIYIAYDAFGYDKILRSTRVRCESGK
jgi:hypothetical protein